ncbi:tigger transposable element-derived protein 6-like [Drosophila eugracilis]|uniref:tigger transposable element-derived protein 6-like n=1 Tax=Drosophila eugracilis TaxID=29029 RepID=UPI0007E86855|nr:tigger transposable element-derived protein 6-like [Drosophila eugracilis]
MLKSKRVTGLTIKEKLQIIAAVKDKVDKKKLSAKYKCDRSTINRIIKQQAEIEKTAAGSDLKRKRQRKGEHDLVEEALYKWFEQQETNNVILDRHVILAKAKEFCQRFNDDYEPDANWLWRWRKRHNIKSGKIHGEIAANEYQQDILPGLIKGYNPENIFNADETGLFYKAMPTATFYTCGNQRSGNKSQKIRITILFICNATGSYKKAFLIGRSKSPRCFKNVNLPLPYYANKKAWMTSETFRQIITQVNAEMKMQNRKILLFIDNATSHSAVKGCDHIKFCFLPANTTAVLQPLEQGIIHSFKLEYRRILVKEQLIAVNCGKTTIEFLKTLSMLDVVHFITQGWAKVKTTTIQNCFKKAGFNICFDVIKSVTDEPQLVETVFDAQINWEEYANVDADVACHGQLTEDEIVRSVLEDDKTSSSESESDEDSGDISRPTIQEGFCAVKILKSICMIHKWDEFLPTLNSLENKLFDHNINATDIKKEK